MKPPPRVTVMGWGAHHALAVGSRAAVMAARARQLELRATAVRDTAGEPIAAGLSRSIDAAAAAAGGGEEEPGAPRGGGGAGRALVSLVADAVVEAGGARPGAPPLLLLCAAPEDTSEELPGMVGEALGRPIDPRSRVVRGGPAAFAVVLEQARSWLLEGAKEVVAAAVDSPRREGHLAALAERGVLHVEGAAGGRVLAEAAACLRLAMRRDDGDRPRLAAIERMVESADREGELGRMLRRARGAVARQPARLLVDVTSDEPRTRAWQADREAMVEGSAGEVADAIEVWSDDAGDVGVATGAWLSVVAMVTARTGAVPGGGAVIGLRDDRDGAGRGAVATIAWDLPRTGGEFVASTDRAVVREVGRVRGRRAPRWASAHRDRLVRSLLEDLGSLGLLLAPGDAGPGRNASAVRLVQALDALAAIAIPGAGAPAHPDLLEAVRAYGAEVSPPDRARRFAVRFVEAHVVASAGKARAPS